MNDSRCAVCGLALIDEEKETHECRKVVDCRVEGSILWLFDGFTWYPRKLLHLSKGQKNPTEFYKYKNRRQGNGTKKDHIFQ